ncbi:MAG: RNA polymerase sigma factor WhiG [Actinobacteria bacterium]|nr:RNA polymerase sigma factor WhiG [Actinomycetota bacterium]MCG2818736.1 RNA polymerase sigma factor WhiG [Actinomycetes bacterium]MBU4218632.1 RNA polymerase sigma factor WhiG [Actinomycetota bacterium]MBU4359896.1 RNA polymerase sigma factor WhiG [Actinomycetota bacterium]MBU4391161.1 RNA polymerase sigma factor WhiG [Actinomycetota bacterium]
MTDHSPNPKKSGNDGSTGYGVTGRKKDDRTRALWVEYKQTGSAESREEVILHYAPLVKYVAGRVSSGLPSTVEFGDLVSYGVFGLLDAIEKYDPERGIKFETYAIARIKGAIIDELRADDWVPRSVRFKAREIERAYVALESELRRIPTDEEVADRLGVTLEEYVNLLGRLSFMSMVALDELWTVGGDRSDKICLADTVEDMKVKDPSQTFELEEMKDIIANAINRLPERERIVVSLYYYEGLTMREIGEVLLVTESRVCQMHTKAILRLRARLGEMLGFE